jgi:hypothetical protein
MEHMSISDGPSSTQAFMVSTSSNYNVDREVSSISENDQSLTQAFTTISAPTSIESTSMRDLVTPTFHVKIPESISIPSAESTSDKSHSSVPFQLTLPRIQNRPTTAVMSSIQPQVTSNDVQQMLLTFSPDPASIHEDQPQPMEHDSEQLQQQQQQQRSAFSMPSSIESTASIEEYDH